MGMVAVFRRVDDNTISMLIKHPKLVHRLLAEEDEATDAEDQQSGQPGFFDRLFGRVPAPLPTLAVARQNGDEADLDKAWNAIHFMLTGAAEETEHPLGFIVCGGVFIGDEEVGYGPARAFSAAETQKIAGLLRPINREAFLSRFDSAALLQAKVYPDALWEPKRASEENHLYVAENFEALRNFLLAAADTKQGFITFLS